MGTLKREEIERNINVRQQSTNTENSENTKHNK
jgi:hypothetical protein